MNQITSKHFRKARRLEEIDQAVKFNLPVGPDHDFYTNFSDLRGNLKDRKFYGALNVNHRDITFDPSINAGNKSIVFLGGMRGSGKTSELLRYAKQMHKADCFFVVTCNIDIELNKQDLEYVDILIFQLEKLIQQAEDNQLSLPKGILQSMEAWFHERVLEINKSIVQEAKIEVGLGAKSPGLLSNILQIFGSLKAGVTGSKERATKIRQTLKNHFSDFALKFNEFVEEVNLKLRERKMAQEILFIIDGLEKTLTPTQRRDLILGEGYTRLPQIRANTLFVLPLELMRERAKINQFSDGVFTFPFVKLRERNGDKVWDAYARFFEFVYKRIDRDLFENEEVVEKAIHYGGGSPRELLRILQYANWYADEEKEKITMASLDQGITELAAEKGQYLTRPQLDKLKTIKELNEQGAEIPFDDVIQELLEDILVLEYNDGNYKRVHPLVEESSIYKQEVG